MRWLLLVIALAACKSKSEPAADQSRPKPTPTKEGPGGLAQGSGSGDLDRGRGSATPTIPTPTTKSDPTTLQPVAGVAPRKDPPRTEPAPATPTPARPDDTMKPAAAPTEKPAPDGFAGIGTAPLGGPRLPPGTIGFTSIAALDSSTLTVEEAGALIKTEYQAGLKRCYLVHLSTHPDAKGTAKVTFTVETNGQVIAPAATSFAKDLDPCLAAMAGSWRFRVPTDPKTMKPARVRFAVELAFQPG